MKKILIFILLFNITSNELLSNKDTNKIFPKSFTYHNNNKPLYKIEDLNYKITKVVNVDSIIKLENDINKDGKIRPEWYGWELHADYTTYNSGTWDTLDNRDRIWRLRIISPLSKSLNILFNNFRMSNNSYLFVYNHNKTAISDRYDNSFNSESKILTTSSIHGNDFMVELYLPYGDNLDSFKITGIVYGYKDIEIIKDNKSNSLQSASCHIDANCPEGHELCREKYSIATIQMPTIGSAWDICTASLLNNTNLDFKPYTLTAFHCLDYDGSGALSTNEKSNVQTWNFKFGYMRSECGSSLIRQTKEYSGSTFRAAWHTTDFALLELNQQPKSGEMYLFDDVYYNGWDRSNIIPTSATTLHHPDFDYLKFSKDVSELQFFDWYSTPLNNHIRADFDIGTVQHGSSGSPLFNQNRKIVGQLHGYKQYFNGMDFCSIRKGDYGALHYSWTGGGTNDTRLSNWLDPNNTGVSTLNGIKLPNLAYGSSYVGIFNYNAYDQMKVGSNAFQAYEIPSGTTMNLKAGREIVIRPCSYIRSGSNFRAYIEAPSCSDIIDYSDKESDYANTCPTNSYPKRNIKDIEEESESIFTSKSLSVFPNPASDKVNITYNLLNTESRILTISNSFGNEIIKDIKLINMKDVYILQLSDFSSGVYFVTIKTDIGIYSEKFEIVK